MPESERADARSRSGKVLFWLGASLGLLIVVAAMLAWVHRERLVCQYHAYQYRNGDSQALWPISDYMFKHHKEFKEEDLERLLGPARRERIGPDNESREYFADLWDMEPNGSEVYLIYSDRGPPDHELFDSGFCIEFLLRDNKVFYFRVLP